MTLNKFDIKVWEKYFDNIKVKKGVYQSTVFSNTNQLIILDNFNNIVNIMTSNIEVLLGKQKSLMLYKEAGLEQQTRNYNDDPVLYLKCDELKLVDSTVHGLYDKINKVEPRIRSLSTFNKRVKQNKSKFMFRGFLIEIIREGDIYGE